jgi:hypothetical protein
LCVEKRCLKGLTLKEYTNELERLAFVRLKSKTYNAFALVTQLNFLRHAFPKSGAIELFTTRFPKLGAIELFATFIFCAIELFYDTLSQTWCN